MPSAEIITIGTELLLGEILDTNTRFLARALRDTGVDLFRTTTVGDNVKRIANTIQESLNRCNIIITTGGLGPTVDDPTREAIALAVECPLEYRPELWEQIRARFQRYNRQPTENNQRQAFIPSGAIPIENPVGTAPAFIVEKESKSIISLPGVPREMEYLMQHAVIPYLKSHFQINTVIKTRLVHTAGMGESMIDDLIGTLETLTNPTVGLSAHSGQVDIRITAKANSNSEAEAMIYPVEQQVRQFLGQVVYGVDEETLENAVLQNLHAHQWTLAAFECGLNGELISRLALMGDVFRGGEILPNHPNADQRLQTTVEYLERKNVDVAIGVFLIPGLERQEIFINIVSPSGSKELARPYGGPPGNAAHFAVNNSLDLLRNL